MNLVNKLGEVLLPEWNFILTDYLLTGITTARSVDYLLQPHTLSECDSFTAIRDDISLPNRTGLGAKVLSTSKARVTTPAIRGGVGEIRVVVGTARPYGSRDSRAPLAPSARGQSPLTSRHLNSHDVRTRHLPRTQSPATPSRCASFTTSGRCERRTWSGGDSRATTAPDGEHQWDPT